MSIIVNNGTPIPTSFSPQSLEAALPKPQLKEILRSPQNEDAWCYAACAEMVFNFFFQPVFITQCKIASFVKLQNDEGCCAPAPDDCTEGGCTKDEIGEIFERFAIDFEDHNPPVEQISLSEIISEISDKHPIEVVIDWNTNGTRKSSHAFLITGFSGNSVHIVDPLRGLNFNGWQPFSSLVRGFGQARWVRTWTGLVKKEES